MEILKTSIVTSSGVSTGPGMIKKHVMKPVCNMEGLGIEASVEPLSPRPSGGQ